MVVVSAAPFLTRITELTIAVDREDVPALLAQESWLAQQGSWVQRIPVVQDALLLLDLNRGRFDEAERRLNGFADERHRFWLMLLYLRQDRQAKAQDIYTRFSSGARQALARGLLELAHGSPDNARKILSGSVRWQDLTRTEQTLRHLALVKAASGTGDFNFARSELDRAKRLEPNNPALLSAAFDLSLASHDWAQAKVLAGAIDAQTWRAPDPAYLAAKVLLELNLGFSREEVTRLVAELAKLPDGKAYASYVQAIIVITDGDIGQAQLLLERSVQDAQDNAMREQAGALLRQVQARLNADKGLKAVMTGSGE